MKSLGRLASSYPLIGAESPLVDIARVNDANAWGDSILLKSTGRTALGSALSMFYRAETDWPTSRFCVRDAVRSPVFNVCPRLLLFTDVLL